MFRKALALDPNHWDALEFLGLTLYELLALRPAFAVNDRLELIERVKNEEPPRLRIIDAHIPRDLETIVLKAISKDPGLRYQSAEAMAEDLGHFLRDEPISARRATTTEQAVRWFRRNPAVAGTKGAARKGRERAGHM